MFLSILLRANRLQIEAERRGRRGIAKFISKGLWMFIEYRNESPCLSRRSHSHIVAIGCRFESTGGIGFAASTHWNANKRSAWPFRKKPLVVYLSPQFTPPFHVFNLSHSFRLWTFKDFLWYNSPAVIWNYFHYPICSFTSWITGLNLLLAQCKHKINCAIDCFNCFLERNSELQRAALGIGLMKRAEHWHCGNKKRHYSDF